MSECMARAPLFPGDDYLDQVQRVIGVLGTPSEDDMEFISNPAARRYITRLPKKARANWKEIHPNASDLATDLLDKMLVFKPTKRWTVE
jgi:mitogen-activated protein kinase 1/3